MGGDTGKIIGYVALAAAVVVVTGPAGMSLWGAAAPTGTAVAGGAAGAKVGAATATKGMALGGTGATGSYAAPALATTPVNFAGGAGLANAGAGATQASWGSQALGSLGTAASNIGGYVAENPLSSYFLGSGALNQMTAPGQPEMPMPDFTSLQQAQTYDQSLSHMGLEQLNKELSRPGITPAESNSIKRAMQNQGMSMDNIEQAEARAKMGEERYAEVSKTMGDFRDATMQDQESLDAQAALIYATYKEDSDKTYDDVRTQLRQNWAGAGRLNSRGGDDAFAQVGDAQARHNISLKDQAMVEAMRRNTSNADLQQKGVNAILQGANFGQAMDQYNQKIDTDAYRYGLGRNDSTRDQNYTTALLGQQGQSNYDLAKYKNDSASANAQALQGLESAKLGMGFYNNPLGNRAIG